MVIQEYINSYNLEVKDMKFGMGCETDSAIFLMPDTYMNNSGKAVRHYLGKVKMDPSNVCVIQDDMDIEKGRVLLKFDGGDNGHNGIRSINTLIGSKDYYRLRVGVGRPIDGIDPADYLLSDFASEEMEIIKGAVQKAAEGINMIIKDGFIKAMNKINRTKNQTKKEEEIND